jgi:hypothetical protein
LLVMMTWRSLFHFSRVERLRTDHSDFSKHKFSVGTAERKTCGGSAAQRVGVLNFSIHFNSIIFLTTSHLLSSQLGYPSFHASDNRLISSNQCKQQLTRQLTKGKKYTSRIALFSIHPSIKTITFSLLSQASAYCDSLVHSL